MSTRREKRAPWDMVASHRIALHPVAWAFAREATCLSLSLPRTSERLICTLSNTAAANGETTFASVIYCGTGLPFGEDTRK